MYKPQPKRSSNLIYGLRPVIEALKSGKEFDKLLIQKGLRGDTYKELAEYIDLCELQVQYVPTEKLDALARNSNHQGVVGFVSMISYASLENIIPTVFEEGRAPFVLILDRITDVRNFGAIVRTAACCGIDAVIIPKQGAAQINEDALKTSAGALYQVNICREENLKTTIHFLKASGLRVIAATEKATNLYTKADFTQPVAIVMGSEEDGISPEYLKLCDERVSIPLIGEIASLNVSVACGVMLYEVIKQRKAFE